MRQHMIERFGRYARVLKSLYGLKQATGVWYLLLSELLISIRFECTPTDQKIFVNLVTRIIVGIHVDDLLITGPSKKEAENLKEKLKNRFGMKDLGFARNELGI